MKYEKLKNELIKKGIPPTQFEGTKLEEFIKFTDCFLEKNNKTENDIIQALQEKNNEMMKSITQRKETIKKFTDQYEKNIQKYTTKPLPQKIGWHDVKLIDKENGTKTFKHEQLIIIQKYAGFDKDLYPLSNNEIIEILKHYDLNKKFRMIIIHNYMLRCAQGVTKQKNPEDKESITLWHPSKEMIQQEGKTNRQLALFVYLHEISHALGNVTSEKEADRFGWQEYKKWTKIMPRAD